MSNESISAILERTLGLIQSDETTEAEPLIGAPSAASILLAEKRRLKDQALAMKEQDFVPLSSLQSTKPVNYFMDQIAESTVEPPTHWKGLNAQKSKIKEPVLPVITNVKKASKLRGEAYQDKRLSKHASTASRKDRMHRLKNLY